MNATPQYLLEGSYYALIQCGRLLNSAATLYKTGDHVTALGLAALAWEELGRSCYLKDQRKKVVDGKTVSIKEIKTTCENHLTKQEWGQVSTMQRFSVDSVLGKLTQILHKAKPQSKEYQDARAELDEGTERQRNQTPQSRHKARMKAFYVEPLDLGRGWNKPWEKDGEEALHFIQHAISDYAMQRNNTWVLDILKLDEPELAEAIEAWKDRPDLPPAPPLY